MLRILYFVFLLTLPPGITAQTVFTSQEDRQSSEDHIKSLKSGILLVKLDSQRKKLETLQREADNATSEMEVAKWNGMLEREQNEAEMRQRELVNALENEYKFSAVAYFFDHETPEILSGEDIPVASDLKTPVDISGYPAFYILEYTRTPEASRMGYVILDSEEKNLARPFPNNVIDAGFSGLFRSTSGHIRRLNKLLEQYYSDVMTSESDQ